ncbi:MAG: hypothetical protein KatS3mg110_0257 [Pirellulaceae bacterium]|nr:MAG: hypothetical protein KatS3mg110_0257 [Pirellulaceae bacterium]
MASSRDSSIAADSDWVLPAKRVFLTGLGTRAQPAKYSWNGRCVDAKLTPLALLALLPPDMRPTRVVAVITEEARQKTWPVFAAGVQEVLGTIPVEPVVIPVGRTESELSSIVTSLAEQIPEGADLLLDVTQGLRHLPFILYALVIYLTSLKGVRLRGAYYGMLEVANPDNSRPIVDLGLLLDLPEWFHAVKVFRDQGSAIGLAHLLREAGQGIRNRGKEQQATQLFQQATQLERTARSLERHWFAHGSALPLELGYASVSVADNVRQAATLPQAQTLPLISSLAEIVAKAAEITAFSKRQPAGGTWKASVPLDQEELARQARVIDLYLERRQIAQAAGMLREWVVSWVMWQKGRTTDWLGYSNRKPFERLLGALGALVKKPLPGVELNSDQRQFGEFWNKLCDSLRNSFMHHGMRPEAMLEPPASLEDVVAFWKKIRDGQVNLPDLGGGSGNLLVSPQGRQPGVLFSAIRAAQRAGRDPQRCLVVCSRESAGYIAEAQRRAGFTNACQLLVLEDAFAGFSEMDHLINQAGQWLFEADHVLANLTGGTTLMGILVQRLIEQAQRFDRPVGRFALIDRRPPDQQAADPYVEGECHWLDHVDDL